MSKKLQKFFHYCLSKLKNPRPQILHSSPIIRILSNCKQPKTPSIAIARGNDIAATLSDIDRFLFENFKSLFLHDEDSPMNNNITNGVSKEEHEDPKSGPNWFNPTSLDLLSESSSSRESIVIFSCSTSQYENFGRSMKEMVDGRLTNYGRVDWEFMEKLLFSYLNLNEKKSHKFILSAYVDLINSLRECSSERAPTTMKPRSVRTFGNGREIRRKEKTKVPLQ